MGIKQVTQPSAHKVVSPGKMPSWVFYSAVLRDSLVSLPSLLSGTTAFGVPGRWGSLKIGISVRFLPNHGLSLQYNAILHRCTLTVKRCPSHPGPTSGCPAFVARHAAVIFCRSRLTGLTTQKVRCCAGSTTCCDLSALCLPVKRQSYPLPRRNQPISAGSSDDTR